MEAGKTKLSDQLIRLDLVDAMIEAADPNVSDERIDAIERSACPTCGSCSGMFTANSMNCLTEALGLSLPGNGSMLATHADRKELFLKSWASNLLNFANAIMNKMMKAYCLVPSGTFRRV